MKHFWMSFFNSTKSMCIYLYLTVWFEYKCQFCVSFNFCRLLHLRRSRRLQSLRTFEEEWVLKEITRKLKENEHAVSIFTFHRVEHSIDKMCDVDWENPKAGPYRRSTKKSTFDIIYKVANVIKSGAQQRSMKFQINWSCLS